jgi:GntP family gluconate:H+ symporter
MITLGLEIGCIINFLKGGHFMTGLPLIFVFILAIILMIMAISKFKIHPFIAIMIISLLLGLVAGIPLTDKTLGDGTKVSGLASVIGAGFSGTFSSIGIVIILGALIGTVLEKTGAALKLADMVIKLVGKNNPVLAIEMMGWVVSIPVFCDSGFVILNPIRKALVNRTAASSVAMTVGLSSGLYISHVFIPPTPGPIAAASTLGIGENLLLVMGMGALCSIFPLIAGFFYARYIGKKVKSADEADMGEIGKTYEELVAEIGKLPSGANALAPIVVPILLMALSSAASMAGMAGLGGDIIKFLGTPIIALAVGTLFSIFQLKGAGKMNDFYEITNETLKTVGPILFVTAAGGVLGKVISSTDMVNYIKDHASVLSTMGIFFPFILAAILKSAQGSSTVALTTTAGIVAPLLPMLGLESPVRITLACMAIGAGAMTVSHANDSYFWVVTNFGAMTPEKGYKTQTVATLILGIAGILEIFILSLVLH